jgi:hypothetical protein
MRTFAG